MKRFIKIALTVLTVLLTAAPVTAPLLATPAIAQPQFDNGARALAGRAIVTAPTPYSSHKYLWAGDSHCDLSFTDTNPLVPQNNNTGYLWHMNRISGGQFTSVINACVSGNDTQQLMARYTTDIAAHYADYDTFGLDIGVNGIRHGYTPEAIMVDIKWFIRDQINHGKRILWILPTPVDWSSTVVNAGMVPTVANARKAYQHLRNLMKQYARSIPSGAGVITLDAYDKLVDPTSANGIPNCAFGLYNISISTCDGIHWGPPGGTIQGQIYWTQIRKVSPYQSPQTFGPENVYDSSLNITGNALSNPGFMTQTGGTGGGGAVITGAAPSAYAFSKYNGTWLPAEMTISYESPTAGAADAGGGAKMIITCSMAIGKGPNETLQVRQGLALPSGYAVGDVVQGGVLFELVSGYGFSDAMFALGEGGTASYEATDGSITTTAGNFPYSSGTAITYYYQTRPYTIQANGTPTLSWNFRIQYNAVSTLCTSVIKISQPFINKVIGGNSFGIVAGNKLAPANDNMILVAHLKNGDLYRLKPAA